MAMTLNGLTPTIYNALDVVVRSRLGFLGATSAFSTDVDATNLGLDQTITVPVASVANAADIVPGQLPPNTGGVPITNKTFKLQKSRAIPIQWTGEEVKMVNGLYPRILSDQFELAFNKLADEVESDFSTAAGDAAATYYGTPGTLPFGVPGELVDFAQIAKILDDQGAPAINRALILDSAAKANIRGKQSVLFKTNEAGTDQLLRRGIIGNVMDLEIRDSKFAGRARTAGTGTGYLINNGGGYAVGARALTLDGGSGTILAGDTVTIGGYNYSVTSFSAGVLTINEPGLVAAVADNAPVAVVGAGTSFRTRGVALQRGAMQGLFRLPAVPPGGDGADDALVVTDPLSGISFEVRLYRQYRQIHMEVGLAWGWGVLKPDWIVGVLG